MFILWSQFILGLIYFCLLKGAFNRYIIRNNLTNDNTGDNNGKSLCTRRDGTQ